MGGQKHGVLCAALLVFHKRLYNVILFEKMKWLAADCLLMGILLLCAFFETPMFVIKGPSNQLAWPTSFFRVSRVFLDCLGSQ